MSYTLTLEQKPAYLHAIVTGENSRETVACYLADIRRECVARGCARVLVEERLEGARAWRSTAASRFASSQALPKPANGWKIRGLLQARNDIPWMRDGRQAAESPQSRHQDPKGGCMISRIVAGFLAALAAASVHAFEVRPLIKAGLDLGGDTLLTAVFTNGDTETIKGNEGVYFGGGAVFISDAKDWEFQVTAAYKFSMINADNGDIEWTRWPIEALAFYRWHRVRAGGGLVYHLNPQLDGSGVASNVDVKYKNALGAVLQVDWRITERIALGGRYTFIEYDVKSSSTTIASGGKGNGFGVSFSMNF